MDNTTQDTTRIPLSRGQSALIDVADFPLVSALRWYASWSPVLKQYYAMTKAKTADGRPTTLYMHRLITGCPKGKIVDHVNHDTLDNRRENLRVGSQKNNMQNGAFALRTHCPKGHPYDEANTYHMKAKHGRKCRTCAYDHSKAQFTAFTPEQKAHRKTIQAAYYQRTKPERAAQGKAYAMAHRDKIREYNKRWREARKQFA